MYKIKVISDFSSAHMLRQYKGKCENMHGHNWKIEARVASSKLDEAGMVMDFKELKRLLNAILDELDHKNLNELPYFKKINPTSENIAKYIYDQLAADDKRLTGSDYKLKVTVWESDTSAATYGP